MSKFEIGQKVKITNYPVEAYNGETGVIKTIITSNDFVKKDYYYIHINSSEYDDDYLTLYEHEMEVVSITAEEQYVQYVNAYLDRPKLTWKEIAGDFLGVGVAAIVMLLIFYFVKVG